MLYITDSYYGRKFFKDGRKWMVIWNNEVDLEAVPDAEPTSFRFSTFKIEDITFIDN